MSLCILAAGKTTMIAATAFTLSWTHSVQKSRWEESWRVGPSGLQVVEARVEGSGAGMEPPPDSVFRDGWWIYRPNVPPQPSVALAASGATGAGWTLCANGACQTLGSQRDDAIILHYCE
ncbi:hypothetical protein ASD64_01945 [Mesorhizobium sp. Root157]|uniref:DUF1850 domain-containing protein n=1 Tax=Mesorhizobium sp. Root157 TaxID=1736477 RepID=UPI0006FCE116|nr:DUF1850 domain-containing protein [Mesorhizobium sp. Root157]KRA00351.1 hypothetical protein ASD64_01945 [Mesorhizobium sp. Root157]